MTSVLLNAVKQHGKVSGEERPANSEDERSESSVNASGGVLT